MWTTQLPCFSCLLLFMLFLLIFTDIKVPHSLTRIHLCVSSLQFHGMWGVWYQIVNLKKILDMLYINLWKWGKKKEKNPTVIYVNSVFLILEYMIGRLLLGWHTWPRRDSLKAYFPLERLMVAWSFFLLLSSSFTSVFLNHHI